MNNSQSLSSNHWLALTTAILSTVILALTNMNDAQACNQAVHWSYSGSGNLIQWEELCLENLSLVNWVKVNFP